MARREEEEEEEACYRWGKRRNAFLAEGRKGATVAAVGRRRASSSRPPFSLPPFPAGKSDLGEGYDKIIFAASFPGESTTPGKILFTVGQPPTHLLLPAREATGVGMSGWGKEGQYIQHALSLSLAALVDPPLLLSHSFFCEVA